MPWWEKKEQDANRCEWQALKTPEGLDYYYNAVTGATVWDKPAELMTDDEMKNQGEWVWIPDPIQCYMAGTVQSRGAQITCRLQDGQTVTVPGNTVLSPLKPASLKRVVSDLVLLDDMSTPLILHNLRARFERREIYTNVGTIVISINPYQDLGLYTLEKIYEYQHRGVKEMPPHVFNTAHNAYKGLCDFGEPQSIIISGESGAGKTEATKQCLSYIAAVAGSVGNVEQKVLKANPILEAFGNAKTVRNDNSSRFGKYMELFFGSDKKICGSMTTNYLLEKIRVVQQGPTERNFHAFYQLVKSATGPMKTKFQLCNNANDYTYLNQSGCIDVPSINDARDFQELLDAFNELQFSQQDQDDIFSVTSAVLALGNVHFGTGAKASVSDRAWADCAAKLLQVDTNAMCTAMTVKVLQIRGAADTKVILDGKTASDTRHALSKFLYGNMFDWIVQKVNKSMNKPAGKLKSIGILDIFGFEIFEQNSFEQLCINFTNEMLQQHFNNNTFKLEEKLYKEENIQFQHVDFIDNQPVLDLIQGRGKGILPMLDEELVMPRGSDQTFLQKMHQTHARTKNYKKVLKNPDNFIVIHYAGEVTYDAIGFLEKNRDTLTQDLLGMLYKSKSGFINVLFPSNKVMSSRDKKSSLSKQFQKQLLDLMRQLNKTAPHYIRCVKPNAEKSPSTFTPRNCLEQLTYSGVFEAVCIRKQGFPFRLKHDVFVKHYSCIMPDPNKRYPNAILGCKEIIQKMNLPSVNVQMGASMVLYRADEHKALELQRSIKMVAIEMEEELARLVKVNISSYNEMQKEKYFEELSRGVEKADEFRMEGPNANKARKLLDDYIESRIDDETKFGLQQAHDQCHTANLEYYLGVCTQKGYRTKLCKESQRLLDRIYRVLAEVQIACNTLEEHHVDACISAGDEIALSDEWLDYFRTLKQGPLIDYLTAQYDKARENKSDDRAIRLDIRRKDEMFKTDASRHEVASYAKLKQPQAWAGEKFMGKKELLALGMLSWQKDKIHAPLCVYTIMDKEKLKAIKKCAKDCFKYIMKYMGQRIAKTVNSIGRGRQTVSEGLAHPEVRDEIYIQLIKQITNNMEPHAVKMAWDMMALCLLTFPPTPELEDILEVYIRRNAPSGNANNQYKGWLRQRVFHGAVAQPPTEQELEQIEQTLASRSRGFSEPLPPGAPSYQDLLESFYAVKQVANTFRRDIAAKPAPAAARGGPAQAQSDWQELPDESGDMYYWNSVTGVSSWDKPPELMYGRQSVAIKGQY